MSDQHTLFESLLALNNAAHIIVPTDTGTYNHTTIKGEPQMLREFTHRSDAEFEMSYLAETYTGGTYTIVPTADGKYKLVVTPTGDFGGVIRTGMEEYRKLADKIQDLAALLNTAIHDATQHGLRVDVEVTKYQTLAGNTTVVSPDIFLPIQR